jgi:uncharacterized protein YneF (UPF0154 family)
MQNQDEAIMLLSTVTADFDDPDDAIFNYSCEDLALTTRTDVGYVLNKQPQSYDLHIRCIYPEQNTEPASVLSVCVSVGTFPDDEQIIDEVTIDLRSVSFIDDIGIGVSLCDICTEIVVGQSMNEAIVSVTDMFLSHTKVSTSDAISLITTIPSLDQSDGKELIQAILAVSNQGTLSNYAWSGALRSILGSGKDAAEKGSIVLQKDSPFVIQSFMNTVLQIAQVAFSALLVALVAILQGLLAIIAGIVSIIITSFKSFTTDINIDPDSNNEYVRGVFGANASFKKDQIRNDHILKSDSAIRSVVGPFELFTWLADDSADAMVNMNLFMNLSFNAHKLMDHILDAVEVIYDEEEETFTISFDYFFNPYDLSSMDDFFSHDTDYLVRLHFDKDALLRQYKLCTMVSALSLMERNGTYILPSNSWHINNSPIERMIGKLLRAIAVCKSWSYDNPVSYLNDNDLPDVVTCRNYLNALREHFDDVRTTSDIQTTMSLRQISNGQGWEGKYVNSLMNGAAACFRPFIVPTSSGLLLNADGEEWDQLIPAPSVSLPEVSTDEVVAAIGLIIGVVGAAFLASKSISRRLKARRQVKFARRADKLNSKRDAYLSNPQDKALKKEYTSALVSYDKRASLFGWPSYDAVNGRMNVNIQGSVASSALNGFLSTTDTTEYIASLIK